MVLDASSSRNVSVDAATVSSPVIWKVKGSLRFGVGMGELDSSKPAMAVTDADSGVPAVISARVGEPVPAV
jgi:hypothetical protein